MAALGLGVKFGELPEPLARSVSAESMAEDRVRDFVAEFDVESQSYSREKIFAPSIE